MAVRANKPAFNIREKLKELTHNIGLKGRELMSAATTQDARNLVSAGRKNLVHNGDFRVDQRGGPHTTISGYHFDRWKFQKDGLAQYAHSVTQSSDSPDEFNNSLRLEVTTSETGLSTTEDLCLTHHIEGQDCQALMAGTSSAKPFTLSFWVKSTKTGNYSTTSTVEQSGTNKIFSTAYRINQANTWEYKVVKFPPCPGVIADTTSPEISFRWILNAGTAYTTGTNLDQWADYASNLFAGGHETQIMTDGDVWQITGVQVEVGENATDFEYRSYGEELALCQRYYERHTWESTGNQYVGVGVNYQDGTLARFVFPFLTRKRVVDPVTTFSGTYNAYPPNETVSLSPAQGNDTSVRVNVTRTTSYNGGSGVLILGTAGSYTEVNAEL